MIHKYIKVLLFFTALLILQSCIEDQVCTEETWYQDADADGFGNPNNALQACEQPAGYVEDNTDFDDANASAFPNAMELCNGIDDNGDGTIDENPTDCAAGEVCENGNCVPAVTYYIDQDGDLYGDAATTIIAGSMAPNGYVLDSTDCDDTDAAINPGATEVCGNGIDDNCDGNVDENCIVVGAPYQGGTIIYVDSTGQAGLIVTNSDIGVADFNTAKTNCTNLIENGYSDWYLPNRFQLQLLYTERANVNGLSTVNYWSAAFYNPNSISNPTDAYYTDFSNGVEGYDNINMVFNYRAVRNF